LNIANLLSFTISGFPGNIWQVPAHNKDANLWISKVLGVVKTKAEAQAIVDAEVQAAQAAWDALSAEEQAMRLTDQLT
jgi:alpha-D-ribose 1-methylphosphonate 5-triphosphate synthase subunit PhnG